VTSTIRLAQFSRVFYLLCLLHAPNLNVVEPEGRSGKTNVVTSVPENKGACSDLFRTTSARQWPLSEAVIKAAIL
jgi:hypothetical protein